MHAASISQSIDRYLETLRSALDDVPPSERHEVVEEIRTHILERIEQAGEVSESGASEILRAVGDPKELAAQYKTEVMLRRAVRSKSPWLLLNTTLRWSLTGFTGLIAFLLTVMGYGSATVCYLCAVLKPLFPSKIGLWVGPELMLTLGYRSTHYLSNRTVRHLRSGACSIRVGHTRPHQRTCARTAWYLAVSRSSLVGSVLRPGNNPVGPVVHSAVWPAQAARLGLRNTPRRAAEGLPIRRRRRRPIAPLKAGLTVGLSAAGRLFPSAKTQGSARRDLGCPFAGERRSNVRQGSCSPEIRVGKDWSGSSAPEATLSLKNSTPGQWTPSRLRRARRRARRADHRSCA